MSGEGGSKATDGTAQPALRDAVASASYRYHEALMEYEDALANRDVEKMGMAEERLHGAARLLSDAQSALVAARSGPPARPSFTDLLGDPSQQVDPTGEVLRSVLAYRTAAPASASASSTWPPPAIEEKP